MVKAFSYLRVSGKGQVQGDGLPRQRAAIRVYAKTAGYTIVREFADEGVSGTNRDHRPASLRRDAEDTPRERHPYRSGRAAGPPGAGSHGAGGRALLFPAARL